MLRGCRDLLISARLGWVVVVAVLLAACDSNEREGAGSAAAGEASLRAALREFADASFAVEYAGQWSDSEKVEGGQVVLAKEGSRRLSIRVVTGDAWLFFLISEEVSAVCSNGPADLPFFFQGLADVGAEGVCTGSRSVAGVSQLQQGLAQGNPIGGNVGDYKISVTPERIVLGQRAACYHGTEKNGGEEFDVCFGASGAMLYRSTVALGESSVWEATSLHEPSSAQFELPFPLIEKP